MTRVDLVCLDDDNQGKALSVLWELELGAKPLQPEEHGLGDVTKLDEPRHFAAYLHALKWNSVTATDATLFQSPFRAGIKLMNHQLTPLQKALELPRANLFIADDVGLGKTIEAGLILQELLLRQRVAFVVIVCPASVALQWRDEMQKRFGLGFEIYNRAFVARRRQERGFTVNPWSTHNRFIVTYQSLRRPEYRDPLLQRIEERERKSLLILDEAHTAAPATASKYATDSNTTHVIRDVAPRFENRLFLSATPHNGHSNSFSALLEILDPQRFTRGVPVLPKLRDEVMVRRLKSDLRELGVDEFPERKVIQIDVTHEGDTWHAASGGKSQTVGTGAAAELELSRLLHQYTQLRRPAKGRGRLVFINLQKRLLSSVEAFARTLSVHHRNLAKQALKIAPPPTMDAEDDEYGAEADEQLDLDVANESQAMTPDERADRLLDQMMSLAEQHRGAADGKTLALIDWIQQHQSPALAVGGARKGANSSWTDRRVIIFTEYGDTKRYLWNLLTAAAEGTDRGHERIMQFHGGMSDEQREEVQRAFNGPPDRYPVRILIATDAAREGVNLQGHCADLFHYDIPWNPARMEQRNGRIDRTLQPQPEVRCHYFFYRQRAEDIVLHKLVNKVETIHDELGSLGEVIMGRLEAALEPGIDDDTGNKIDKAATTGNSRNVVEGELEGTRNRKQLEREMTKVGELLNRSSDVMEFKPALLRDALDVGLELCGAERLTKTGPVGDIDAYMIPELPDSWQPTIDTLRPARDRDEPLWEWRKRPPLPVVFRPPAVMTSDAVHLHLQHPFVRRVLGRFLSQGYSAHDLSRVTIVSNPNDALVRAIAFGRLSLFGPGAVRLHDEIISVAAQWLDGGGPRHLKPFADEADRRAIATLEELLQRSPAIKVGKTVQRKLLDAAPTDFATLWTHIHDEADARAHEAKRQLTERGNTEADALRDILQSQRKRIEDALRESDQLSLAFEDTKTGREQRRQFENDKKHMKQRLTAIDKELESDPESLKKLYEVALQRLEPVGLIYLWPESRG